MTQVNIFIWELSFWVGRKKKASFGRIGHLQVQNVPD
jgi:hypothetical protein